MILFLDLVYSIQINIILRGNKNEYFIVIIVTTYKSFNLIGIIMTTQKFITTTFLPLLLLLALSGCNSGSSTPQNAPQAQNVEKGSTLSEQLAALPIEDLTEEVDLLDLYIRYDATDNHDVHLIYDSLMKGSRNHLRSFVSNLETQGIIYLPLHLTQEEYDAIINTPMENGQG